jgi:uncharacterized protein (TIGR02611 family)
VIQRTIHLTYKAARRIAIAVLGTTVLAIGIVMIVAPGPALIVIPIGLAILGAEFAWARLWLRKMREAISNNLGNGRARKAEQHRERVSRQKRKAPER